MSNDPSKTLAAVNDMRQDWAVVDPLMGGTRAMRAASTALLPKWPKEEREDYDNRLKQSTLLPAYSETVKNMTGRVFAEPLTLGDDIPEDIKAYAENFDRQNNNLQVWAQTFFSTALAYGLCHVLIDYPKTVDEQGNVIVRTKADEKATNVRPYAILIRPQQVLGWRSTSNNGEHVLTQFRYLELIEEDDGEFGTKFIPQVRVLTPGGWATYREQEKDGLKAWLLHEQGTNSLKVIPLVSHQAIVNGLDPQARSRLNGLLMTGAMAGMAAGAAIGSFVWAHTGTLGLYGFAAAAALAALAVSFLHHPLGDHSHD
ncbi:hypothetical protein [Pseudomonas typographi]|uniref:hypothetical protein n=1 Tax=Pseudomonas typographi TaxID=2715964 RepID=UPI001689A52A|nr:hypothetical protein [Pseudomonas typographi]